MLGDTLRQQLLQFVAMCGAGFLLGLYYEFFKSLRLWYKPTVIVCVFQDVFFCVSAALITFFMLLGISDGTMPPYVFIGEICGFFVFYGSLGRFVHKTLVWCFKVFEKFFGCIKRKVLTPVYSRCVGIFWHVKNDLAKKRTKQRKTQKKSIFFSKKP